MSPPTQQRVTLRVDPPFELCVAVFGHGWVDLAPNRWDPARQRLFTAAWIDQAPVDLCVTHRGERLVVTSWAKQRLRPTSIRRVVGRMLRLDESFAELWRRCAASEERQWVAQRGAGRLLRAPTLFEDLAKLLLTTNCNWSATRQMVDQLLTHLGTSTPRGNRAFPSAQVCAERDESFYREVVRLGYRARYLPRLAERCAAGGALEDSSPLATDELRRVLLALPGFGPYAAGQALRLLGHYDDLALDSWCRARLKEQWGRTTTDRAIERHYARFGRYRGLVLWLDLTRHWHDGDAAPLAATPQ